MGGEPLEELILDTYEKLIFGFLKIPKKNSPRLHLPRPDTKNKGNSPPQNAPTAQEKKKPEKLTFAAPRSIQGYTVFQALILRHQSYEACKGQQLKEFSNQFCPWSDL